MAALISAYRAAPEYTQRSDKTRKDYQRYLAYLEENHGRLKVATMPREFVFGLRDKFAATPRKANYIVQVLRLLMTFAVDRGWRKDNPVTRPKLLKTGAGFRPWEEEDLARFQEQWPHGTLERTIFELMLNTGQRGGDVAAMDWAQIRNDEISIVQEKTSQRVWIPISMALYEALNAWRPANRTGVVLVNKSRDPLKVDYLRHLMADAMALAKVSKGLVPHGLRYTAATRLRELGLDWEEIAAITGHATAEMVRKYTSQQRKAKIAIGRLNRANLERK
jgi:integrase